jgi:guanylate kinase
LKKGKLIVFSAPSGSGKTTLVKALLRKKLSLSFSISATSREPRVDEIDGKDYYFLSTEEFKDKIHREEFIEFEEVYTDKYYGTLKSEVERNWEAGKHVIFDIDVVGGLNIKSQYPEETLALFIQPPNKEVLEERLRSRGTDNEDAVHERIAKAEKELEAAPKFDSIIINDDLDLAIKEVCEKTEEFLKS